MSADKILRHSRFGALIDAGDLEITFNEDNITVRLTDGFKGRGPSEVGHAPKEGQKNVSEKAMNNQGI